MSVCDLCWQMVEAPLDFGNCRVVLREYVVMLRVGYLINKLII